MARDNLTIAEILDSKGFAKRCRKYG